MKPTRGGKRANAGRKKRPEPCKTLSVKIERADHDKLKGICKARKTSQAKWVTNKIQEDQL